jgi:hypothetical protein
MLIRQKELENRIAECSFREYKMLQPPQSISSTINCFRGGWTSREFAEAPPPEAAREFHRP